MDKYKQNVPFKHVMPDGTKKEIMFVKKLYTNCHKCVFYLLRREYCLPCGAFERDDEVNGVYVSVETK